jgi:hypothetical protein
MASFASRFARPSAESPRVQGPLTATGLVEGIADFVHERQLRASLRPGQAGTERRCPPQDSLGRSSR